MSVQTDRFSPFDVSKFKSSNPTRASTMATPAAPFTRSPSLSYGRSTSRSFYGSPAPLAASLAAAESDHSSDSEPHAPAASPPPSPVPPRVERPLRALDAPIAARDARGKSLAYVSAMICGAACLAPVRSRALCFCLSCAV